MDLGEPWAHGWSPALCVMIFGLVIGSFLNVVISRLPVMLDRHWNRAARQQLDIKDTDSAAPAEAPFNLLVPRSQCRACGHQIRIVENIPILSWLVLRGRCSQCGTAIGARYPLVELITAVAPLVAVASFGWTWLALAAVVFSCLMIVLAGIDFETHLLPDQLTLPLLWAGLIVNTIGGFTPDAATAIIGAAGGYLFLWLVYWIFKWTTRREGMGYGDFKLFAAIGAWLGWTALPLVVLFAAVAGLAYGLFGILTRRTTRHQPIPFGPFLAVAGWAGLVLG